MVVQAHESADIAISASPSNLSFTGKSTLGEYHAITATPQTADSNPSPSRLSNFSPRNGTASIAVNSGLNVIIREASPAAVHFIPYMKNAWYRKVERNPIAVIIFHWSLDGVTHCFVANKNRKKHPTARMYLAQPAVKGGMSRATTLPATQPRAPNECNR